MILTASNLLSFSRGLLAFLFLSESNLLRGLAVFLAMLTDSLDGYIARRNRTASAFGATLDPIMDKFFVIFIVCIFISEGKLQWWQALTMLSRDVAVLLFGMYLKVIERWKSFKFRSILSGKISTSLQFLVLLALIFGMQVSDWCYIAFIVLGVCAFIELLLVERKLIRQNL